MATLDIYMKSGNIISVTNVKDWQFKSTGDVVTYFRIEQGKSLFSKARGLLVNTLDISNIEAIVER